MLMCAVSLLEGIDPGAPTLFLTSIFTGRVFRSLSTAPLILPQDSLASIGEVMGGRLGLSTAFSSAPSFIPRGEAI
jgi:hypothetical protein